jgi:hypothetical protein
MKDEQFQKLQELDPVGVPSLSDVTKEVMRGPDVPLAAGSVTDSVIDLSVVYSNAAVTDLPTTVTNFEEACQSGPYDMVMERRQRDRSGNKPKVRKWKNRAKTRAARKARRNNR